MAVLIYPVIFFLSVFPQGCQATPPHGLQLAEKEFVWGNSRGPHRQPQPR